MPKNTFLFISEPGLAQMLYLVAEIESDGKKINENFWTFWKFLIFHEKIMKIMKNAYKLMKIMQNHGNHEKSIFLKNFRKNLKNHENQHFSKSPKSFVIILKLIQFSVTQKRSKRSCRSIVWCYIKTSSKCHTCELFHVVRGIYWGSDSLGIRYESHFFPKHFFTTELKPRDFVSSIFKWQKSITRKK